MASSTLADDHLRQGREALAAGDGCRMLFIFTPGGFEELLRAISRPAESRTLPPPSDGTPPSDEEMQVMMAAIQAHGCELLD